VKALACLPTGPRKARIHVKVDTGTMRQGIFPEQLEDFLLLAKASPRILIEGLSTHYANIEDTLNHEYAEMQIRRFNEAVATADRTVGRLPYIHTACTAATILFSSTHFTMLRSGIGLYGLWPSRETLVSAREKGGAVADLRPVLSWKTRLAQIKTVPEGSYVGYGCSYKTLRKTLMGVLPIGYSDGYDRALGSRGHVLVRGRRAPLIGRICMNLCMIDLTDIPGVRLRDRLTDQPSPAAPGGVAPGSRRPLRGQPPPYRAMRRARVREGRPARHVRIHSAPQKVALGSAVPARSTSTANYCFGLRNMSP
jgi:alanine racemase